MKLIARRIVKIILSLTFLAGMAFSAFGSVVALSQDSEEASSLVTETAGTQATAETSDSATPQSAPSKFILRLLTFNVQGIPIVGPDQSRHADTGRALKAARLAGTAPHVVAIQEAFVSETNDINRFAQYPYHYRGPGSKGFLIGSGLLILSEFPISGQAHQLYEACASWDCWARKSAVGVKVHVPGLPEPIELLNTHLNSNPDGDIFVSKNSTMEVRGDQLNEMLGFMVRTMDTERPVFVIGDFNMRYPEPQYAQFLRQLSGISAVDYCAQQTGCEGHEDAKSVVRDAIDHQFYRRGSRIDVVPVKFQRILGAPVNGRRLSDHSGFEVHYELSF